MSDLGILGTGAYVPDRVVSNDDVGAAAGVDDAWIRRKTAIRERRWAAPGQATSDLAAAAGRAALRSAGITADQLSVIVVATSTPDRPQPPTAAYVQHGLGAAGAAAFDVNAVCSGSVFALAVAEGLLAGRGGHALVIGADLYSRILNPADRRTVVLFGDGSRRPGPGSGRAGPARPASGTAHVRRAGLPDRGSRGRQPAARRPGRPGGRSAVLRDGRAGGAPIRLGATAAADQTVPP